MATANLPAACADALARHLKPELFKALCDPRRLTLVAQLAMSPEPTTVSDAASCCGVHISGVSRHLAILRDAGVLTALKRGREVVYQVNFRELVATLRGLADALEDCCTTVGCCEAPTPSQES